MFFAVMLSRGAKFIRLSKNFALGLLQSSHSQRKWQGRGKLDVTPRTLSGKAPRVVTREEAAASFDVSDLAIEALPLEEPELMDSFSPFDSSSFEDLEDFRKRDLFMTMGQG
jgi:hypothetical protein